MTEQDFVTLKEQGQVKQVKNAEPEQTSQENRRLTPDIAMFLGVLQAIQRPRRALSAAPTFTPKNLAEQIQFYESGSTRRMYFYVNGTWRYATLT